MATATARALFFNTRIPGVFKWEGSSWKTGFVGGDYQWLIDDGKGGRNLDARSYFFYMATVNTPAIAKKFIGKGSQYVFTNKDKQGRFLIGDKHYRLNIPANVPAKKFGPWWFMTHKHARCYKLVSYFPVKIIRKMS